MYTPKHLPDGRIIINEVCTCGRLMTMHTGLVHHGMSEDGKCAKFSWGGWVFAEQAKTFKLSFDIYSPAEASAGIIGFTETINIEVESGDPDGDTGEFTQFMQNSLREWYDVKGSNVRLKTPVELAWEKMWAAQRAAVDAADELAKLVPPGTDEEMEAIACQLADRKPSELLDELGMAYMLTMLHDLREETV